MTIKRNEVIDICRGITAILMILGHSFITYPVDISNVTWCSVIEHFIYTFHMEMFFVLAGLVYKCSEYKLFVKNKIMRIAIPYLFFGIITIFFKAFGGATINGTESVGDGVKKLLLYGGNYWFLYVLFLIFLFYPLFEKVTKGKLVYKILLISLCFIARFFVPDMMPLRIDYLVKFIPYFAIGNMLSVKIRGGVEATLQNLVMHVLRCSMDNMRYRYETVVHNASIRLYKSFFGHNSCIHTCCEIE